MFVTTIVSATSGYNIDIENVITKDLLNPILSIVTSLANILKEHEHNSGSDRYDTSKMRNYRLVQVSGRGCLR